MVISKIFRFIKGYISIIIEGLFPERFINICSKNNISLWDIKRVDKTHLSASLNVADFKRLHTPSRNSRCKIKILKKYGLPFFLYKHKKRKALGIGILMFFIILSIMTKFIWVIEITGNENVSDEAILNCAESAGLYTGMLAKDVDSSKIQAQIITDMEDLAFVSVNRTGNVVNIDVRERTKKREHFDQSVFTNIVAEESGVIESILVQNGTAVVSKGDVVYKGQLLVSGANDSKVFGIKYSHSDADIKARVWHEKTVDLPAYETVKTYTGKKITRRKLKIFNFSINLFIKNKISFEKYDILSYTKYISIGKDKVIPIGAETTVYTQYIENRTKLTEDKLKNNLIKEMDELYKDSEIVNRTFKIANNKMTVTYECIEDIAKEEEINDDREIPGS